MEERLCDAITAAYSGPPGKWISMEGSNACKRLCPQNPRRLRREEGNALGSDNRGRRLHGEGIEKRVEGIFVKELVALIHYLVAGLVGGRPAEDYAW